MANIIDLNCNSGLNAKLLWTNSSPTAEFAPQTITLSDIITNYTFLLFEYRLSTMNSTTYQTMIQTSQLTVSPESVAGLGNAVIADYWYTRSIYWWSTDAKNLVRFADCTLLDTSGTVNNSYMVPTNIYGIKGKIAGL